ncbi:MAG TPA: hypothetical protein VIW80_19570 [Pyrinomonadaceae bacterium]|jgi:hypothetical protein
MNQKKPEAAQPETSTNSQRQDIRTHTPIIISGGGSVKILFEPSDYPPNSSNPAEKTHTHRNSSVARVDIIDDINGTKFPCPEIPHNGRCTVTIHCQRNGRPESNITVSGATDLKLSFEHGEYRPAAQAGVGSHFARERQITEIEIKDDNPGGRRQTFPAPSGGVCTIKIFDRH